MTDILTLARENGFSHIGFADMSALEPLEEVRKMCSADRCGQWNTNWSCPPACGSIEHAKRRIAQYNKCLLVQTSGELADEFDYDGHAKHRQNAQACVFELCEAGTNPVPRLPSSHGGRMYDMQEVYVSEQAVQISGKAPVVNGSFRPVCKRCMLPFGTWIQLRSAHDDLYLVPSVF